MWYSQPVIIITLASVHMVQTLLVMILASLATNEATVLSTSHAKVLAFGDSWAWLGTPQFREVFEKHNVSTAMHAIPGTPAAYWAYVQPHALVRAVDEHDADAVYLSIGGNDFLEGLPAGHFVEAIHLEMLAATRAMLDRLLAERPHVHVLHFGYELLDWHSDPLCKAFGLLELFGPRPLCVDVANATCMTTAQAQWLQTKFIDAGLAHTYRSNSKYHGLNLLGTLQVAGGVPGARVGAPVWSQYSPRRFVRTGIAPFGCVHLTPEGYAVLYEELAKHVLPHLVELRTTPHKAEQAKATKPGHKVVATSAQQQPCRSDQARECWVVDERPIAS